MIDTPQNCFVRAAASRQEAEGPMLASVRNKHLASAAAWESLARILLGKTGDRHALPLSKLPEPIPDRREVRPGRSSPLDGWENEGGAVPIEGLPR